MNRWFVLLYYAMSACVGSAASVLASAIGVWNIWLLIRRRMSLVLSPLVIYLAISMVALGLAELVSTLVHFDGFASTKPLLKSVPFLFVIPIFARLSLSSRKDLAFDISMSAAVGGICAALLSLIFFASLGVKRMEGFSGNQAVFGLVALVLYGLVVPSLFQADSKKMRLFWLFGAACAAFAVLASGTRVYLIPLALIPIVSAYFTSPRLVLSWRFWALGFLAILVLLFLANAIVVARIYEMLEMLSDYNNGKQVGATSLSLRLVMWSEAWRLFLENPLFGVGPAHARELLSQAVQRSYGQYLEFTHAHNAFLTYMLRDGVLGLVGLLAILAIPLVIRRWQLNDRAAAWGFAALINLYFAYVTSGLVGVMFGHDVYDGLFVFTVIALVYVICGTGHAVSANVPLVAKRAHPDTTA